MTKRNKAAKPRLAKAEHAPSEKRPLIEHLHELRRRLFIIAATVVVGSGVAYGLERKLVDLLLRPSHGQHFIYTSPLGGMNFLFSACLDVGLVVATPVIIYQLLAFLQPIMKDTTRKFLLVASAAAGAVALCGVLFGYFIGLPSALHFLLHQFTTVQVKPLITIQAYMQFVALYLLGSALMFQLPLILLLINRIKPLKPSGLFKYERHLIAGAFIVAFIMNPTPNIIDQLFVVLPIIISYQVGIGVIWFAHKRGAPSELELLREQDTQRQAERTNKELIPLLAPTLTPEPTPEYDLALDAPAPVASPAPVPVPPTTGRPQQYAAGFSPETRRSYLPLRGQLVQ